MIPPHTIDLIKTTVPLLIDHKRIDWSEDDLSFRVARHGNYNPKEFLIIIKPLPYKKAPPVDIHEIIANMMGLKIKQHWKNRNRGFTAIYEAYHA